jgi:EAL domain-containing protein (putative c-di-GMP-specific phosphodiesterase class I)
VDLRTGAIIGAEALARWQHPDRGMIPPGEFIGMAETSGLILPLGNQLLEAACRQAALWPANAVGVLPDLHANLTVRQLHSFGATESIAHCLRISGLDPSRLTLEVLESALVDGAALSVLQDIHALGVKLFLDDFGTGYSALGYLANLPIDGIKIDRAFIIGLATDSRDYGVLEGILSIACRLNLEVVAEGIETEGQRQALLSLHSFTGQGYLFSRAVPAAQFRALLDQKPILRAQAA